MPGKPAVQIGKAVVGRLQRERCTELRLPARPLEKHHEIAGDAECEPTTEILLYQRQRQVDAGSHSGRAPYLTVFDEDPIWFDLDGGIATTKQVAIFPMCDGAAAVEQARRGKQEGAGADRCDPSRPPGPRPQ